jgi:coenzyme F420-reducing hydrogenase alpha subunit
MEIKEFVSVECKKEKFTYQFIIPVGATLGEAYDACFECLTHIVELQKKASENMARKESSGDE